MRKEGFRPERVHRSRGLQRGENREGARFDGHDRGQQMPEKEKKEMLTTQAERMRGRELAVPRSGDGREMVRLATDP
jgi:hypothetical protein